MYKFLVIGLGLKWEDELERPIPIEKWKYVFEATNEKIVNNLVKLAISEDLLECDNYCIVKQSDFNGPIVKDVKKACLEIKDGPV